MSEVGKTVFEKVKEDYELEHKVPEELMIALTSATSKAHTKWQESRESNQFADFESALSENIKITKQLIPYWRKEEKTDYDVLLNQYEPGMTVEILDQVFDQVKEAYYIHPSSLSRKRNSTRNGFSFT